MVRSRFWQGGKSLDREIATKKKKRKTSGAYKKKRIHREVKSKKRRIIGKDNLRRIKRKDILEENVGGDSSSKGVPESGVLQYN